MWQGSVSLLGSDTYLPVFKRKHEGFQGTTSLPEPLVTAGVEQNLVFGQNCTKQAENILDSWNEKTTEKNEWGICWNVTATLFIIVYYVTFRLTTAIQNNSTHSIEFVIRYWSVGCVNAQILFLNKNISLSTWGQQPHCAVKFKTSFFGHQSVSKYHFEITYSNYLAECCCFLLYVFVLILCGTC